MSVFPLLVLTPPALWLAWALPRLAVDAIRRCGS